MNGHRRRDPRGMLTGGLIVSGIGVYFLLRNLNIIPGLGKMWPVILIVVGVALIFGSITRMRSTDGTG